MQKDLLDELTKKPQREIAGSDAASRFDYQKNWAFCEMLRRHMENADYLVAFEFHDDVVFLEPSDSPSQAEFIQVKTTSSTKPRKLADFLSRKKQANSILGKMCLNFDGVCANFNPRVILVSNVAFQFSDADIAARDLDEKYRKTIQEKLKAELPGWTDTRIENMHFMVSGVSIDAMQSYLHGEAMALFKSHFGEDHGLNVHSWVRLVQGEITRKNNHLSDTIATASELIAKKCMSRSEVIGTLALVAKRKRAPDMNLVNQALLAAGWSASDLMRVGKNLPIATFDCTDATNAEVIKLVSAIEAQFDANGDGVVTIGEFLDVVYRELISTIPPPYNDKFYLSALAILVFHEKI